MPDPRFDVLCIGNAIVDVLAQAGDEFLDAHGMVKGSMQLIDAEVSRKLYDDMPPAIEASGGSAGNTAAGLASLGSRVAFIGKVADDLLGTVFSHDIRSIGVHFEPMAASPGDELPTARCLILVTPDGERTLNTFLGISSHIGPADVDDALAADAAVVYCEGYLWDMPAAKQAIRKAMEAAHAGGRKVAFTLSDSFCVDRHRADFLELCQGPVDILFANEAEICALFETDDFDAAADGVAAHCELAALTRSAQGSVVVSGADRVVVPAVPVDHVVDTTGAGDQYAAGFLHGFTSGRSLEDCARLGHLAAGEVITHVGARPEHDLKALAARL